MPFEHMRFWRIRSYVELTFDAEEEMHQTNIEQPIENKLRLLSCSSYTTSASDSSNYLAQDPMYEAKEDESLKSNPSCASLSRSIHSVALDVLDIGEITVDDEGTKWKVRQCFCDNAVCPGKAFWRVDGKDELDIWDRGRPMPDE